MSLTFVGLLQCLAGLWIVARGSLNQAFAFLLASSLFGGSAAAQLPALGNSSIPPVQFALLFLYLRLLMPRGGYAGAVPAALRANAALVLFTLWGIAGAIAAPRIFAGKLNVAPLRFDAARSLFDTVPLEPTAQNMTSAVYLLGAMLVAVAAHIACRFRGGANTLVIVGIVIAWVHAVTGILGALAKGTPVDVVFELFRNGSYAQLEQSYGGFLRISGVFPEASGFAGFGLAWFFFNCECWYRSILPRATGRAALVLGLTLFFSTSSTAYIGLSAYLALFVARAILLPEVAERKRLTQAGLTALAGLSLSSLAMALVPHLPAAVWDMILHMTVEKEDSVSGRQRLFWAMQGWHAFLASGGLGVGAGSFRSSSLITAIVGSMGVVGIVAFGFYLWTVIQPLRHSTWARSGDPALSIGGAAACTALMIVLPASIGAPSPDPGTNFAIFAGTALALRPAGASFTRWRDDPARPGDAPRMPAK